MAPTICVMRIFLNYDRFRRPKCYWPGQNVMRAGSHGLLPWLMCPWSCLLPVIICGMKCHPWRLWGCGHPVLNRNCRGWSFGVQHVMSIIGIMVLWGLFGHGLDPQSSLPWLKPRWDNGPCWRGVHACTRGHMQKWRAACVMMSRLCHPLRWVHAGAMINMANWDDVQNITFSILSRKREWLGNCNDHLQGADHIDSGLGHWFFGLGKIHHSIPVKGHTCKKWLWSIWHYGCHIRRHSLNVWDWHHIGWYQATKTGWKPNQRIGPWRQCWNTFNGQPWLEGGKREIWTIGWLLSVMGTMQPQEAIVPPPMDYNILTS